MDRFQQLDAARRIDWRFLLPTPELGRVAVIGPIDAASSAAIADAATELAHDPVRDETADGGWDVVIVEGSASHDRTKLAEALALLRPGGWLLANLPTRARARGALRAAEAILGKLDTERVERHWQLPDRRTAQRVVSLDDRQAIQVLLSRHGRRPARRVTAGAARQLARAGMPADVLGGDVSLLARRGGGDPVSGWPSLEPLGPLLEDQLGLTDPSWILLTPRFPASAHVVILLLAAGEVRHVAKIARLRGDDGPNHEARVLESLAAAGLPAGAAPRLVASTVSAGHAVLVEEALSGRPLDRSVVREDPQRWIRAASVWLAGLPRDTAARADLDELLWQPLDRVRRDVVPSQDTSSLVARTREALMPLSEHALPAVMEHGDLSHPNLLVRHGDALGVLDWELARPDGLPLNDLCFFLGYVALATCGEEMDPVEGYERMLAEPAWGAIDALHDEAARVGIDRTALPALLIACWVRAYATHLRRATDGKTHAAVSSGAASRYYRLWEGTVDRQEQLTNVLV